MRLTMCLFLVVLPPTLRAVEITTEEEKTIYALGLALADSVKTFQLTPAELALVTRGLADGVRKPKQPALDFKQYYSKIQSLQKVRLDVYVREQKEAGDAFRSKQAQESGTEGLPSGLLLKAISPGTGPVPQVNDEVRFHYRGTLIDGTEFDRSKPEQPMTYSLKGSFQCWDEGLARMRAGGKAVLICPPELAFGNNPAPPGVSPGATVVFEVELIGVKKPGQ